jgi:hypothetical protein
MNARPRHEHLALRWRRALVELLVIFVGVTAAFFVEGYRSDLDQAEQLRQVTDGLLTELRRHEIRSKEHADSIESRLRAWRLADATGARAVPAYYIIPGAPYPPTAAWDAAVASGVASLYDPELRLELGYYFAEFVGIHDNYVRRLRFIESEILPRARSGPDAFYDSAGTLRAEFATEMELLEDYRLDLAQVSEWSGRLYDRLSTADGKGNGAGS